MGNLNVKLHHLLDQFSTDEKRILLVGASLYIHYALHTSVSPLQCAESIPLEIHPSFYHP